MFEILKDMTPFVPMFLDHYKALSGLYFRDSQTHADSS